MSELEKYKKLADQQRQGKAKIEGKLETLYEDLEEEGFPDLANAKGEMIILGKKIKRMRKLFDDKLNLFKEKHAGELSKES